MSSGRLAGKAAAVERVGHIDLHHLNEPGATALTRTPSGPP
jgi:hypothetical protein